MASSKWYASLKMKLLAATVGITIAFTLIGSALMYTLLDVGRTRTLKLFHNETQLIGSEIGAQFYERYGDSQAFSTNLILQDQSAESREKITPFLNEYIKLYGIYDLILYVDKNGKYVSSSSLSPDGKTLNTEGLRSMDFQDAAWFKNTLASRFTEDKKNGFSGSFVEDAQVDPISSAAYGEEKYGNSFSSAVKDRNGQIIGVITNRANFSWVEKQFQLSRLRMKMNGIAQVDQHLFNRDGRIIFESTSEQTKLDLNRLIKTDVSNAYEGHTLKSLKATADGYAINRGENGRKDIAAYHHVANEKWVESIGWDIMITDAYDDAMASELSLSQNMILIQGSATLIIFILSWILSTRISANFMLVAERLGHTAEQTHTTSLQLTTASESVSASSSEQSAAVQETVSSMSEISSMISQTNQHVKECTDIAARVTGRSEQGNQTMRRLAAAMDAVNHANAQLQNMANIINEVSMKTMVINDIVFKTQLLSINASIEAARAGQHGKGFAVVAEEVGNLAQMSGNAAKEIQLLISDSQKQVVHIIEVTQARSKESQQVSQEAVVSFSEIATGIQAINERLAGVTQATHEQELGIQQISVAMSQMDQTTQRNSSLAAEANTLAQNLGEQSEMSHRVVKALRTMVIGSQALKIKKAQNLVDVLMSENSSESGHSSRTLETGEAGLKSDNLLSLVSRFEDKKSKLNAGHESSPAYPPEIDADDSSFKKPA